MKKKYIAITISIVLIALIITFGQIFTVRNVKVEFKNETGLTGESDILRIADIKPNTNIFSLKESRIKENINNYYANSLVVNVERTFPNTVIIHVKERLPMFLIHAETDAYVGYVYTDKDFQRSGTPDEVEGQTLITVNNYFVRNTFDTAEAIALRAFANALFSQGFTEGGIVAFVESISIGANALTVNLRQNDAVLVINRADVVNNTLHAYNAYLDLPIADRAGVILNS